MKLDIHNPGVTGILAEPLTQAELDFLNATVLGPPGVNNPDRMHDEDFTTRAQISGTGNYTFVLDLGSIDTRPLKAVIAQFRSPLSGQNWWYLETSDDNSSWTTRDSWTGVSYGGTQLLDAGTLSFRYCRCRSVISFATWNMQAYMGTTNS